MRQIAVAMVFCAMLLARPAIDQARANDVCSAGCTGDLRTCVHDGGAAKLACRADCRSAGGHVGACVRACRAAFRDERASCRALAQTCAGDCESGDDSSGGAFPDPACPGQCGRALGRCLHDAAGGMPACLQGCPKGRERHSCVADCLTHAKDGGSQCHVDHDACIAACGGVTSTTTSTTTVTTETTGTTTTTSTSLPPPVLCGDAEAPTCDGSCPDVTQACAETQPGVCGCVGGSAGSAFTGRQHHGRR